MELKAGKGASERPGPDWKAALQREREEQQHLLAESYSAVMELTRQLQLSERHWSQEKLQLVERLQGEKQQVEQQVKELQNRLSQLQKAAEPWVLKHSDMEKQDNSWKEVSASLLPWFYWPRLYQKIPCLWEVCHFPVTAAHGFGLGRVLCCGRKPRPVQLDLNRKQAF